MGGDVFLCCEERFSIFFRIFVTQKYPIPPPKNSGGGIFVDYQLFTMKHTQKHYLAPTLHSVAPHAERGFGASLEIPVVDPEQGWTARPADEFIEE